MVFIFDDISRTQDSFGYSIQSYSLRTILNSFNKIFEVIVLSKVTPTSIGVDNDLVAKLADANTVHQLRGENLETGRSAYRKLMSQLLTSAFPKVDAILSSKEWDYVLVPGGLKFITGLFSELGARKNIRIPSFDSDDQTVLLAVDGVSAQLPDIPKTMKLIQQNEGLFKKINEETHKEIEKRKAGTSIFNYLKGTLWNQSVEFKDSIVLILNASWDSAALNRYVAFKNQSDWIVETVKWSIKNTDKKIIIRQHPVEKHAFAATTDDYVQLIDKNITEGRDRVIVVDCHSTVNTYSLLTQAKCCLVHTSTMGLEAVIQRIPVITASNPYYANLDICYTASNRENYFSLITDALSGNLNVTDRNIENAVLCYYITQICNYSTTDFNPCASFNSWTKSSLECILAKKSVNHILDSFNTGVPYSYLVALSKDQQNG